MKAAIIIIIIINSKDKPHPLTPVGFRKLHPHARDVPYEPPSLGPDHAIGAIGRKMEGGLTKIYGATTYVLYNPSFVRQSCTEVLSQMITYLLIWRRRVGG